MVCALVVETSVANNSLLQDSNHTEDHFQSKQCCAKSFLAATTLKFVAAYMSARLNWTPLVSAAKFTKKRFPV